MTATITLIAKTHRHACLAGMTGHDARAYDDRIGEYVEYLRDELAKDGITLEVNEQDIAMVVSYRVEADDYEAEQAAHEAYQSVRGFWDWY
ncbi:hypothetical protein [Ideonella livida]|uniref:Uncharacterized protein n=1 Tax=Ideonella livida TaxID=2707176 RepID=A0A7C9PEM1_9BURK|nr:hypothetical protein [Ideonella livida]NDY89708.1 hypothetical protein [Ideonella livida]